MTTGTISDPSAYVERTASASVELIALVQQRRAAGFTAGVSAGFHYGTEFSVSASQGFFLEGTIGEIPAEHYNGDSQYRVGLFAYPHQLADGHQFMVINYWVAE